MRKISIPVDKSFMPKLAYGFIGVGLLSSIIGREFIATLFLVGMAIFFYFVFKKTAWNLMDEVFDAGDGLVFRRGGIERHVLFEEIISVSHINRGDGDQVVVHALGEGPLGKKLSFMAENDRYLGRGPVVERLIERVENSKREHIEESRHSTKSMSK